MREMGAVKLVAVKAKDRATGKLVFHRGPDGSFDRKPVEDRVERVTRDTLGPGFGRYSRNRLVVRLVGGDQIEFKPYQAHKAHSAVRASARELYRHVLFIQAQAKAREKREARQAKIAERKAQRRLDAAYRRLSEKAKRGEE